MSNLRNSLKNSGYDQEEAYFYKEELRLIEKQRAANLKLVPKEAPAGTNQQPNEKSANIPQLPTGSKKVA